MTNIFTPGYIQLIHRKPNGWFQSRPEQVFNLSDRYFDSLNKEKYYNLTKNEILAELFRKYQGKLGYYLVNLAEKEYYYCGLTVEDIQEKLREIGITRRG